jgi:urease accessory protein
MRRVREIKRAGEWRAVAASDRIVLDSGDRHRRRSVLTGERGTSALLDWPQPVLLKDGDGLVLDDGAILLVLGEREPLLELSAQTPLQLVRLAWHIGNRHVDVQISGGHLRIRRDHVLEDMVAGLGATVSAIEAPFDPEAASSQDPHRHDHGA